MIKLTSQHTMAFLHSANTKFGFFFLSLFLSLLFAGTTAFGQTTYYSASGAPTNKWTSQTTWTTSPSGGFPIGVGIPVNGPGSNAPFTTGPGLNTDNIVIRSGTTVILDVNKDFHLGTITIQLGGTLIVTGASNANLFGTVTSSSQGTLKTNVIVGGVSILPAGPTAATITSWTNFLSNTGGTVEFYGATSIIPSSTTVPAVANYNNLTISGSTANNKSQTGDITLNGNLIIDSAATYRIGNNNTLRTLTVTGNITTAATNTAANSLDIFPTSTAKHQINIGGSLVNNSTAGAFMRFTSLTAALYDGNGPGANTLSQVNFTSTTSNQALTCNAPIFFYQIALNKGTNATYSVDMTASATTNFGLFGQSNGGDTGFSSPEPTYTNIGAGWQPNLRIVAGTAHIGANITIPYLVSGGGNYDVIESARLWVDGGTVNAASSNNGNGAVVLYGNVLVTNGTFNCIMGAGLVYRYAGSLEVDGGTLNVPTINTSTVAGVNPRGSFTVTGGVVNLQDAASLDPGTGGYPATLTNGRGGGSNQGVLDLGYATIPFIMTGGTINIANHLNANGNVVWNVQAPIGTYNVTGGTVNIYLDPGAGNVIESAAPFWDLNIIRDAAANGAQASSVAVNPLVVLHDFTITDPTNASATAEFNPGAFAVTVGRNLTIGANAAYTGNNNAHVLTFNGLSRSILDNSTGGTLTLGGFAINKTADSSHVIFKATTGTPNPYIAINNNAASSFSLTKGHLSLGTFILNDPSAATVQDTIDNGAGGYLQLNGTTAQTLTSSSAGTANIQTLQLANTLNTGASNVTLTGGNLTVATLTFNRAATAYDLFDIGTNNLSLGATPTVAGGGALGQYIHIRTFGNSSDGGLTIATPANGSYLFPIGTNATAAHTASPYTRTNAYQYTPTTATVSAVGGTNGKLTVSVENTDLQTLRKPIPSPKTLAAEDSALSYFWRVRSSGFTGTPQVAYTYTAAAVDDIDSILGHITPPVVPLGIGAVTMIGGYVDNTTFSRNGTGAVVAGTFNFTIPAHNIPADASYTAANAVKFTGTVRIFFSRTPTANFFVPWTTPSSWTCADATQNVGGAAYNPAFPYGSTGAGVTNPASITYPQAGDIAYIGYDSVNATTSYCHIIAFENVSGTVAAAELHFATQNKKGSTQTYADRPFFEVRNQAGSPYAANQNINIGRVFGPGTFAVGIYADGAGGNYAPILSTIDFGNFNNNTNGAQFLIQPLSNASTGGGADGRLHTLPATFPSTFPSLISYSGAYRLSQMTFTNSITVNQDLWLQGGTRLVLNNTATGDVTIKGNLQFSSPPNTWNASTKAALQFPASGDVAGRTRTVTVGKSIQFLYNGVAAGRYTDSAQVFVDSASATTNAITNNLNVTGSITQVNPAGQTNYPVLSLIGNQATPATVNLTMQGAVSDTISKASGQTFKLYTLTVNKSDVSKVVNLTSNFRLNNSLNANVTKNLSLLAGTLYINPPAAQALSLTTGGSNFIIPNTSALILKNNVNATAASGVSPGTSGISLNGALELDGNSTLVMSADNTTLPATPQVSSIEYSSDGKASLTVTGTAALTVTGQIRRSATAISGVLRYNQTGGTVLVGTQVRPASAAATGVVDRGVLEIANPGSAFKMTGGTLTIANQVPGTSFAELNLEKADTESVTGGTINIGDPTYSDNTTTPIIEVNNNPASQSKGLYNLTVQKGVGVLTGALSVDSLFVNNDFTINTGATFQPGKLAVLVGHNFTNNGTYTVPASPTVQSLVFDGFTPAQTITLGGAATTFSKIFLRSSTAHTVTLAAGTVPVVRDSLTIGNLSTLSLTGNMSVTGNVINNGVQTGAGVLSFDNAARTQLISSSLVAGGSYGNITLNNPANVQMDVAFANPATITGTLNFTQGVFDIGTHNLILSATAPQPTGTTAARFIQTTGTNTSSGVTKQFGVGAFAAYAIPVGSPGKFTPVTYTGTATSAASLNVIPLNSFSTALTSVAPYKALQYNWQVTATGTFSALTHVYNYLATDVKQVSTDETASPFYINGYLPTNANQWIQVARAGTDVTNHQATFNNFTQVTADYTTGQSPFLAAVARFWSRNGWPANLTAAGGDVNNDSTWSTDTILKHAGPPASTVPDQSPGAPGGSGVVYVAAGHTVQETVDNYQFYSTTDSGTINVHARFGEDFGQVRGNGRVVMEPPSTSANLPSGDFSTYFTQQTTGGTLEFSGTASGYTLPAVGSLLQMNNVIISGSLTKTVPSPGITIVGNLSLTGANLDLAGNTVTLQGNLSRSAGTLTSGTGMFTFTGGLAQTISGGFTGVNQFGSLTLSKSANDVTITGGNNIDINGTLNFGTRHIISSTGNLVNFTANGTYSPLITDAAAPNFAPYATSYIIGPASKTISSGGNFDFPIGQDFTAIEPVGLTNVSATNTYTAQAANVEPPHRTSFTAAPTPVLTTLIQKYWQLSSSAAATGNVRIFWNTNDIGNSPPTYTGGISNLRVASDNGTAWASLGQQAPFGTGALGSTGSIVSSTAGTLATTFNNFTLGAISSDLPITLVSFTANQTGAGTAKLRWTTASEIDNNAFIVERSTDLSTWVTVGQVPGQGAGLHTDAQTYSLIDNSVPDAPSVIYYRLSTVDVNDVTAPAIIKTLDRNPSDDAANANQWGIFPTITTGEDLNITVVGNKVSENDLHVVQIFGNDGKVLVSHEGALSDINFINKFRSVIGGAASGLYYVNIASGNYSQHARIIKK